MVVIKRSTRSLDHLIHVLAMLARHVQLGLLFGCRVVQTMMRLALGPLVVYVCEDEAMECTRPPPPERRCSRPEGVDIHIHFGLLFFSSSFQTYQLAHTFNDDIRAPRGGGGGSNREAYTSVEPRSATLLLSAVADLKCYYWL